MLSTCKYAEVYELGKGHFVAYKQQDFVTCDGGISEPNKTCK